MDESSLLQHPSQPRLEEGEKKKQQQWVDDDVIQTN
jgi:hypothetical protein